MTKGLIKKLITSILFLFVLGFGVFTIIAVNKSDDKIVTMNPNIIESFVNEYRQQNGLPILKTNNDITNVAKMRAQQMCDEHFWSHVDVSGKYTWPLLKENNITYQVVGENLAKDFINEFDIVDKWSKSTSHNDNLINPLFTNVGTGIVLCYNTDRITQVVVQLYLKE